MYRLRRFRRVPKTTIVLIALTVLFGSGIFRWNAAGERPVDELDARPRAFGDSVVDARTQVGPAIGIRPVDMSRDR